MAKIAYGKIGRSMPLTIEKCGFVGGDNECISVVKELAIRHPEDQFYLVGRNSGEDPRAIGLPDNIFNPWLQWGPPLKAWSKANAPDGLDCLEVQRAHLDWHSKVTTPFLESMDAHLYWMGQHGSSNIPLPMVDDPDTFTNPQMAFAHYCSYIFQGINAWRDKDPWNNEEVYINADPRNYHKMRDLKWPLQHPVLTQFDFNRNLKHERFGDPARPDDQWFAKTRAVSEGPLWVSRNKNAYSRLEVCGILSGAPVGDMLTYDHTWEGRGRFGLLINEARAYVKENLTRKYIMKNWILPLAPQWMHGEWSDKSLAELGITITPTPFHTFNSLYHSVRSTFTTPSSGSGWATTKPWEAFACGTVCFFHRDYDTQGHILKDAHPDLRDYLVVRSPNELARKVEEMNTNREMWREMIMKQRQHFDKCNEERRYIKMIEARIWK